MAIPRITTLIALGIACTGFASNAFAEPPPWAPAHGWRAKHHDSRHHYVYYPAATVYYSPATRVWFWRDRIRWHSGVALPVALRSYVRAGGIDIYLDVARPYLRSGFVERRYGSHRYHRWDDDHSRRYDRSKRGWARHYDRWHGDRDDDDD